MEDPYLDAAHGVLRNRLEITDPHELAQAEADIVAAREMHLYVDRPRLGAYDLAHLRAIHRHLFADIYDWAGELRTVDIAKGSTSFAPVRHLRTWAPTVFARLREVDYLHSADAAGVATKAATLLADVNLMHPFRDGNGRTQRAFLTALVGDAGWALRWPDVTPEENLAASVAAVTDERPLQSLLARIIVPLDDAPPTALVLPRPPADTDPPTSPS